MREGPHKLAQREGPQSEEGAGQTDKGRGHRLMERVRGGATYSKAGDKLTEDEGLHKAG